MRGVLITKKSSLAFHDLTELVNALLRNLLREAAYEHKDNGVGYDANGAYMDSFLEDIGKRAQVSRSFFIQKDVSQGTEHKDDEDAKP